MSNTWNNLMDSFEDFAPQLLAALAILLVGWLIAWAASSAVQRLLHRTSVDNRIGQWLGARDSSRAEAAAGNLVFWSIMLLTLVAALEALELDAITRPLDDMATDIMGFLPNLIAALLIIATGYVIARIVRAVVANFAAAIGVDRLGERAGIAPGTETPSLSALVGLIAFALVLIPTMVAALTALDLPEVARPASNMLDQILAAIPDLFAASLVLVIAYLVGRVVQQLTTSVLAGTGLDSLPARLGAQAGGATVGQTTPSQMAGTLALWAIMVVAAMEAARLVGLTVLAALIEEFLLFTGNIVAGLVVIAIGFWLAGMVARAIRSSQAARADLLARIAQVAIVFLAISIGLGEMGIAKEIVVLAFALPVGAIAVGTAIGLGVAFGLGGAPAAARIAERVASAVEEPRSGLS